MTLTRYNSLGLRFQLHAENDKTVAVLVGLGRPKTVVLDMTLHECNQAWYDWQMQGQFIQDAFRKLPAEQREFLMSGITPTEWNATFSEKEDE